ncbi:hypothetical protein Tco_0482580 [Tanacetum coccineum]
MGLKFLFSLSENITIQTPRSHEENNNDQAPNASFQEAEFINPFCIRVQEIGESSSRNIDNTDVHSFQPQSHDPMDQDIIRTSSWNSITMQVQKQGTTACTDLICMKDQTVNSQHSAELVVNRFNAQAEGFVDLKHHLHQLRRLEAVDADQVDALILEQALWRDSSLVTQTCKLDVIMKQMHCNGFRRGQSLWRLSASSFSNLMQPRYNIREQSNPYLVSFPKGTGSVLVSCLNDLMELLTQLGNWRF